MTTKPTSPKIRRVTSHSEYEAPSTTPDIHRPAESGLVSNVPSKTRASATKLNEPGTAMFANVKPIRTVDATGQQADNPRTYLQLRVYRRSYADPIHKKRPALAKP